MATIEVLSQRASQVEERCEGVRELVKQLCARKRNLEAWLCRASARKVLGMGVKHHEVITAATGNGRGKTSNRV